MMERMRPLRTASVAALAGLFVATACGGSVAEGRTSASTPTGSPAPAPTATPTPTATAKTTVRSAASSSKLVDWTQYHGGSERSGHRVTAPKNPLHKKWTRGLVGQVYGEPLVVGSTLIVATEKNYVYGLNARTGTLRWKSHQLGTPVAQSTLPCGDIDPLGITGTPAYDAKTGSVFVAAETTGGTHTLWAINATTGARRWSRNLDTQKKRDKKAEQERAAVLVTHGRVLVSFGGLAGDCANYVGYVVSTPATGKGASHSYAVPTSREAGMWATPGPVLGYHGDVYVAAGNGAGTSGTWEKSDSVTELTPTLLTRRSIFAPASWPQDNQQDLDLGSSSPVIVKAVSRTVIAGKRGTVYLLKPTMGGVGSSVKSLAGCKAFGGAAVAGTTVVMPCRSGIRALHVGSSSLSWGWTADGIYSSPVIAGPYVYATDQASGDLVVLRLSNGHVVSRHHVGTMPHFPSETVSGDWVFVPSLGGVAGFEG